MKKLKKILRKIKRKILDSERKIIQKRIIQLNNSIYNIDCYNQEELLIKKKEALKALRKEIEVLLNSVDDIFSEPKKQIYLEQIAKCNDYESLLKIYENIKELSTTSKI